jgi:hypothetical protein
MSEVIDKVKVTNIKWDSDDDVSDLSTTMMVPVPDGMIGDDAEEFIADYLTDKTGITHDGFRIEDTVEEGNEFTKARLDAIRAGKDAFTVDGKTYSVSGDTSDEKQMNEDINVSITANGEQDALNLLRKLSGMPEVTGVAIPVGEEDDLSPVGSTETCDICGCEPCGCEQVEEERDIEYTNTPHEETAPVSAVTSAAGGGLNGPKKQYPLAANRGANPIEEDLWSAYKSLVNDVKV